MPRTLVPLAEGAEEMETTIIVDTLRRAGWEVVIAGVKEGVVTASRGVKIVPDAVWDDIDPAGFDIIAVPGGAKGVANLRKDARVVRAVREFHEAGKWVAAVCAGPLVLQEAGILAGRKVTCHPAVVAELTQGQHVDQHVVVDGRLVTSQGAGTCFEFALTLVARVDSPERADAIARGMVVG